MVELATRDTLNDLISTGPSASLGVRPQPVHASVSGRAASSTVRPLAALAPSLGSARDAARGSLSAEGTPSRRDAMKRRDGYKASGSVNATHDARSVLRSGCFWRP